MDLLIPILFFAALMSAISYVGYRYYARPARYYEQLGTTLVGDSDKTYIGLPLQPNAVVKLIQQVGEKVPVSPADVALTRRFLIGAGYRSDAAVRTFYGLKVVSALFVLVVALALRDYIPLAPIVRILIVIALTFAGYWLPTLILDHRLSKRQEELRYGLPDALDLMTICVEAGLGLDQAVLKVSEELKDTHPDIADEFGLVTLEMQAGKARSESLRNLAERTGESELRKLVAILVQTDRFGTSMGESLRTHSDYMRVRRRQEAEERANKVGVKLVFPIFFCILPAMLVIVAGPGLLQIVKHLFPMMRQFSEMNR
jgi:tight adherence protein C